MKNKFKIILNIGNVGYEYSEDSIISCRVNKSKGRDITQPTYDVISQNASVSLIDTDKNIFYLLKNNANSTVSVDVYLNNVLIGRYYSDNITYKYGDSKTTISLTDDMMKLQNFTTPYYKLGQNDNNQFPLSTLISTLFNDTVKILGDKYVLSIDPFTQNIIDNTNLYYGYLKQDTYWNNWSKIAKCGLFTIYLAGNNFVIRRII